MNTGTRIREPSARSARDRAPREADLNTVRAAARGCRACPLWKIGTQTVFGEGPDNARIMLVGEQPGDREDMEGRPFVGPAGRLLDEALQQAGLNREKLYVTNAVKHFKHELRGKRRLHKTPAQREILACNQWLQREIDIVNPALIVALGATAVRSIFGRPLAIQINRGRAHSLPATSSTVVRQALITVHPSFLLRIRPPDREAAIEQFVKDLSIATQWLKIRRSARAAAH